MIETIPVEKTAKVTLPWPEKGLSPNARVNRWQKAALTTSARTLARVETQNGNEQCTITRKDGLCLTMYCYPPNYSRRDIDNILASCKAYIDGMFQALGLDDHMVIQLVINLCEPQPPGKIRFEIMRI